jgi:hypothetical protein
MKGITPSGLMIILVWSGCAAHRPDQYIPLSPVPVIEEASVSVRLVVSDRRIDGLFAGRRPELVVTNDLVELVQNRVTIELARNAVSVAEAPQQLQVDILDYWWDWNRFDFMDYRGSSVVRVELRLIDADRTLWSRTLVGRAQQKQRDTEPLRVMADLLEMALDDTMRQGHEQRLFAAVRAGVPPH